MTGICPRHASTIKEIAWKTKNDTPTGSTISGRRAGPGCSPNSSSKLSALAVANARYLNSARTVREAPTFVD